MLTRRDRVMDKKKGRRGLLFLVLAIVLFLLLVFVGIGGAAKLAIFVGNFKDSPEVVEEDKTPPAPVKVINLSSLPRFVNEEKYPIVGYSESGSTVKVLKGAEEVIRVQVDSDSKFSVEVMLSEGINEIYIMATDSTGNVSDKVGIPPVTLDKTSPDLEITEPQDGQTVDQKSLTIKGKTEPETQIKAGDRLGTADSDGEFTIKYSLAEGENEILIAAVDKAGNKSEKTLKITYTP